MDDTHGVTSFKLALVWLGTTFGGLSTWPLAQWVLLATLVYTVVQTAKVIRDWRAARRKELAESKAFAAKINFPEV